MQGAAGAEPQAAPRVDTNGSVSNVKTKGDDGCPLRDLAARALARLARHCLCSRRCCSAACSVACRPASCASSVQPPERGVSTSCRHSASPISSRAVCSHQRPASSVRVDRIASRCWGGRGLANEQFARALDQLFHTCGH
jgi:transposase